MLRFLSVVQWAGLILLIGAFCASTAGAADEVTVASGKLQGTMNEDHTVRMFKGVPFAVAPIGALRWRAPQPALGWSGVRQADKFGPACLQTDVFGDIYFRDAQPSEDCLNLDIWIPAKAESAKIPVFVWFYGGGFVAGSASEARYDGENLAKKGVIVVEPNYRLGIFGFFSHPELTKESRRNSSGNYGLLDQVAALQWVVKNIAAFGGDPHNITIGGESAGSLSVSALMASPLSRNLFQKAIGESGAFFPSGPDAGMQLKPVSDTEQAGVKFAESVGAKTLAEMRAKSGDELLQAAAKQNRGFGFGPNLDGYFLTSDALSIYTKGEQSQIPLLAGWNADEGKLNILFAPQKPTAKSFAEQAHARFGNQAVEFLKLYPASTDQEAMQSAEALASDDFIAFSTWKWIDMQRKTGNSPVYQYRFEQVPAVKPGAMIGPIPASQAGSRHAGEIEYVFETLKSQAGVPWTEDDFKVSEAMASYWVNFVKTGNPNGSGLPNWPKSDSKDGYQVMHLSGKNIQAGPDTRRGRYEFLDAHAAKQDGKQSAAGQ
ncbi:MAG TPA: carboxylesterase family protein [Candidatus Acidoferrum sp.]